jgi:8-amino-7-oxononanoate synthase
MTSTTQFMTQELAELERQGLRRELRQLEYGPGMRASLAGKRCVVFCSNDYLGLARDKRLLRAAADAGRTYGAGSGASRLICGDLPIHRKLESALADFKGLPAATVFPSGYQANLGVVTSLVTRGDLVICDRLNHASIVDACRLSGAKLVV